MSFAVSSYHIKTFCHVIYLNINILFLFVLNDVIQRKKEDIDIQLYDVAKCFDKMWYEETANDIYDAGVTGDSFVVMANSNQNCNVAVKTPWGRSQTELI